MKLATTFGILSACVLFASVKGAPVPLEETPSNAIAYVAAPSIEPKPDDVIGLSSTESSDTPKNVDGNLADEDKQKSEAEAESSGITADTRKANIIPSSEENENKLDFRVLGGSNPLRISEKMIDDAVVAAGYPKPSQSQANSFLKEYRQGGINSKREAAMFLAQILWESDGLKAKEEYACKDTDCSNVYPSTAGYKENVYHGRGYIQLTWADNYSAASRALFSDDRLLKDPSLVAKTEKIAWGVSYWYWKNRVRTNPDVIKGYFGASTKMINGAIECSGGDSTKPRKRFAIYKKVLAVFDPKQKAIEKGCYN